MYKKLVIFFSFTIHFSLLIAQGHNDIDSPKEKMVVQRLSDFDLKGPVKSFSNVIYPSYKYPSLESIDYTKEKPSEISYFDNSGFLTAEFRIDSLGNIDKVPYAYFKYDSQGRNIESKTYVYEDGTTFISKCEYISNYCECTYFDETGKIKKRKEKIYFLKDGAIDKIVSEDGSLIYDYDYVKNSSGLIVEKITSWGMGKAAVGYTYDSKGVLIKKDLGGNPYYTFEYDEKGRLGKECTYTGCSYSSNGVELSDCTKWKYNEFGDIVSILGEKICSSSPFPPHPFYSYQYEYDKRGNWIKKIEFHDGKFDHVTVRLIEYF